MYHVTLRIHVFGPVNGPAMAVQLQQISPMERFEHRFCCCQTPDQESVSGGNLLILADGADGATLAAVNSWRDNRTEVVLCADAERLAALSGEELAQVDHIWPLTMSPELLRFEFEQLLRHLKIRRELWLNNTYLESLIDHIPSLVWFKDARGAHLKVNNSFCRAVGKTKAQVQDRGHYYIWDIPPEEYQQGEYICLESEVETMEKGRTCLFDENVKTKYGMRKFRTYKTPIFDEDGKTILGTVGIASDVTDYQNMGSELEALIDNIPSGLMICDLAWGILNINQAMGSFFPESRIPEISQNYQEWKQSAFEEVRNRSTIQTQDVVVKKNGEDIILEVQETVLEDVFHNPIGYLCLYRDVTLVRLHEEQITYHANTDELTGLSTRRRFFERLKEDGREPSAMLFIDVDNFKGVNDRFGHQMGDLALRIVANALRDNFPGAIIGRTGGDEFVVVLHGPISKQTLAEESESLQKQVGATPLEGTDHRLSLSIGIACGTALEVKEMIRRSDAAMYAAKRSGKGSYYFYDLPDKENQ